MTFGAFAVGMLLPLMARWISRHSHTPDQVIFLPCCWQLVPGAIGLTGVSEIIVEGDTGGGLDSPVTTVMTVAAIALGVLVGTGLQRPPEAEHR
ncbi:threonine/serine exporter family protein [Streptomyces sp. NBC_00233]|uniref:threonine/serine exporter family protein n=1 Tax=Streptomyces sp. NBC_00233 TaxID=2975686 RepID=UPI00225C2FC2|nr:threonine/serine exporter family protein [Streptomyces sp. NBC_00233]MCX5230971.1 threonine/serine exporter family protein [Streptomyces sp. NBC_00233]